MSAGPLNLLTGHLSGRRLIEASAGTGKTYAVCVLYLRLVLERGLKVEEILVVSFTNAATAELRERIRARLAGALYRLRHPEEPEADATLRELLERYDAEGRDRAVLAKALTVAVADFDRSAIYTIHGFCKRVLDDEPFVTGLPLALELLNDDTEIRHAVLADLYRQWLDRARPDPVLATRLWHEDTLKNLDRELKRRLAKPLAALKWPDTPASSTVATDEENAAFDEARALWLAERQGIIDLLSEDKASLNQTYFKGDNVLESAAQWDALLDSESLTVAASSETGNKLNRFSRGEHKPTGRKPAIRPHRFYTLAEQVITALERLETAKEAAWMGLIRHVVEQGPQAVFEAKCRQRVLAFDDLLSQLHTKLHGGTGASDVLAQSLRTRYPVALVDEFQDTDKQQYGIFSAIYRQDDSLFLVGDPKQAIYSFRNADLNVYFAAVKAAKSVETLTDNQRSAKPYLTALNALFRHNPSAFALRDLHYHELKLGKKTRATFIDGGATRAALQCWSLSAGAEGGMPNLQQARRRAAAATAAEIARLLNDAAAGQVRIDERALCGGDIAVIVPTLARGREVRVQLARLGVGSVEIARDSVFETDEAEELDRILTAVLEPNRPGLVRAALATALLGLTAADIARLIEDEAALLQHVERFTAYRELWQRRGIGVVLRTVLRDYAVEANVLTGPLGERRMTNLRHLAELLHTAAEEHQTPEAVLRWLKLSRDAKTSQEVAQMRLESDQNLVQIVTIHAAKGLEYPIVFCPTLWDDFLNSDQDRGAAYEYHDGAEGYLLDYRTDKAVQDGAKAVRAAERFAERLRLLYVALTRSVHRCYLVVGAYGSGKNKSPTAAGRTALQWLVTSGTDLAAHRNSDSPPEMIEQAWRTFADSCADVSIEPLPLTSGRPVTPVRPSPAEICVREAPPLLRETWRVGSYSGLVHGSHHEAAAQDRDARSAGRSTALPASVASDDILRFPRSNRAGNCVHAVLEAADFTTAEGWPEAVARALRRHPPGQAAAETPEDHAAQLQRMLADLTATVLPPGFALRAVGQAQRLIEWEFHLPSRQLTPYPLGRLLEHYGYPMATLQFGELRGYLHGYADLIAEHAGRFYVIDWKSNFLGSTPADYSPEAVAEAMAQNNYHLQHLLYTVALHRFLATRIPDYDYDRHMGGTLYLFVRGVRPDWPAGSGVYAARAPHALINELSRLLGEETEG